MSTTNPLFPVIAFTHGGSYMEKDWRTELGVNAVDVGTHHLQQYVIDWVVETKTNIYLRNDGAFGYSTAKDYYTRWKNSAASQYVCGMTLLDEPREETGPATTLADDAKAFREVFPGLPVILNLNCFGTVAYNYANVVKPDFLSYEIYMQATDDCSWVARYAGNDNDVDFMCWQAKDVFTRGGMSLDKNQRIMIVFGTYGFGRCINERTAAGTIFGDDMFYQMFSKTIASLGIYLGGIKNYAVCTDIESQLHGDHTPYEHEYVRPYIRTFNKRFYDANLSTPWNLGSVVTPPSGNTVSISSFTASPTSISSGGSSTLSWQTSNATSLSLDNGIGTVTGTSKVVSPASTTTYTLTATGPGGSVTSTIKIAVDVSPQSPATLSLDAPSIIYTSTTIPIRILNRGSKICTKLRIWFNDGGASYVTNRGKVTLDSDGNGFTYTSDDFVCDGGMFYIQFDNGSSSLVHNFRQISRPLTIPSSIVNTSGYGKYLVSLVQPNNESIGGIVSTDTNVATVETSPSNTLSVANIPTAGVYSINLTDGTQNQKVIVVAYD